MRHRICDCTGLGNSEPVRLDNNIELKRSEFLDNFFDDVTENFNVIKDFGGYDFHLDKDGFTFGIEPSYQYDKLQIIHFNFADKGNSHIEQGIAFGAYGSQCLTKVKLCKDYKNKSKFIRFIDKWYDEIKEHLEKLATVNEQ